MKRTLFLMALCGISSLFVNAQSDLFKALQKQDSLMFEVTFNTCDLRPLEYLVSENFEFYHDKGGITN